MLRFKIAGLLRTKEEAEGRVISWKEVSLATGISVSVLSNLASPRGGASTNTRFIEALCRYFRCGPSELMELYPSLNDEPRSHVDVLYPARGAHQPATPNPGSTE
jgi:DNA-binding Xre family transcriptional regulator